MNIIYECLPHFSINSQHIFLMRNDDDDDDDDYYYYYYYYDYHYDVDDEEEGKEDGANHSLTVRQFKAQKAVQVARARAWSQESYFYGR